MGCDKKDTKRIIFIVFCAAVFFALFQNFGGVMDLFGKLFGVFSPVIAALSVAFVLNVLLVPIETKVLKFMDKSPKKSVKKLKRVLGLILTYLSAFAIIAVIVWVIIPQLIDTIVGLAEKMPVFVGEAQDWIEGELDKFHINYSLPEVQINWNEAAKKIVGVLEGSISTLFEGAINATTSIIGGVVDVVFGFVLSVYILAQKEKIGRFAKSVIDLLIGEKHTNTVAHISKKASECFSRFVSGQLMEALILGVLCFAGMLIFRFPNALVISAIVTITALVPIVGATVGVLSGGFIILITNPIKALFFVIFMLVLQQVEGNLIYPKVVGKVVGLPSVIVLSAVLVGGNIGGILGALIGLPTAATVYALIKERIALKAAKKSDAEISENAEEN